MLLCEKFIILQFAKNNNMELKLFPETKGLIFDLDGTIADTMPIHYISWKKTVARYGVNLSQKIFYSLAGVPAYETVNELNKMFSVKMDAGKVSVEKEQEYESNMSMAKPIEPAVRLIHKYAGKLPFSIGTGTGRIIAEKTLELIGLASYFPVVVTSEDVKNCKPNPETFLLCAKLMKVEPSQCQVFEDSELGFKAARKAGMMMTDIKKYYTVNMDI